MTFTEQDLRNAYRAGWQLAIASKNNRRQPSLVESTNTFVQAVLADKDAKKGVKQ